MNVKELVEILQQADPNTAVVVWDPVAPARKEFLADYGFEPVVEAINDFMAGGEVVLLRPREGHEKSGQEVLGRRKVRLPRSRYIDPYGCIF